MYKKIKLSVILKGGYAYSRGYVYCLVFLLNVSGATFILEARVEQRVEPRVELRPLTKVPSVCISDQRELKIINYEISTIYLQFAVRDHPFKTSANFHDF